MRWHGCGTGEVAGEGRDAEAGDYEFVLPQAIDGRKRFVLE